MVEEQLDLGTIRCTLSGATTTLWGRGLEPGGREVLPGFLSLFLGNAGTNLPMSPVLVVFVNLHVKKCELNNVTLRHP